MTLFLTYGRDEQGSLVHIDEAGRGKGCGLRCPFCAAPLVARKGRQVAHHFAHEQETCRPTAGEVDDLLPSYDGLVVGLTARQRRTLHQILDRHGDAIFLVANIVNTNSRSFLGLRLKRFLFVTAGAPTRPGVFAKAGPKARAVACRLTLAEFATLIRNEFERSGALLWRRDSAERDVGLEILQREVERTNEAALYFLEVETDAEPIYKIGVTRRPINERIAEIQAFVRQHTTVRKIKPLFYLPSLSYVERYFKARFADHGLELGQATEYFHFEEKDLGHALAELMDLKRHGRGLRWGETPPARPSPPNRPRFQARFEHYTMEWNSFSEVWEIVQTFKDVTRLENSYQFGHQTFKLGKRFEVLGPLFPSDLIEFDATIAGSSAGSRLKNPTNIMRKA